MHGNRVEFVFATGVGLKGKAAEFTWNIYRDRLRFKTIPGRFGLLLDLFVWERAT